jgi:hypothetical protein
MGWSLSTPWCLRSVGRSRGCMAPSIQRRKVLINQLGLVILPKTKLVLEVHSKGTKLVSVGTTQHEDSKVFIPDVFNSLFSVCISKICGILDNPIPLHVLQQHCIKKGRNNSNSTKATICFDVLDVSKELAVLGMVINTIFLVVSEKMFMQRKGCHAVSLLFNLGAAQ